MKTEVKAERQKEREKDATDMFSRSKDFSKRITLQKSKEEKPAVKTPKPETFKEEGVKSKRRHESTEAEDQDAGAPARKTSLTPSKRSLSLRSSNSPQTLTKRYDAVTTAAAARPKTKSKVISLDSDDDNDDQDLYKAPPPKKPARVPVKQQPTPIDDESDIDPNEEFPELVKRAREMAKQREAEKRRAEGGVSDSKSPVVDEGPNPPISIFIDPRIPDSGPLLVTRKWNQRLREVRVAWCERQEFVADFANTVVLTWKGIRVYDAALLKSLGIGLNDEDQPILSGKDGIDEEGKKIVLVATTQAIIEEEKKAAAEAARKREDEANGITEAPLPKPEEKRTKIMLSAKNYETHKLIVTENTTFERIALNFRQQRKIPLDKEITLMFDGDVLEPEDQMKNSEIEDMDTIEVHIK